MYVDQIRKDCVYVCPPIRGPLPLSRRRVHPPVRRFPLATAPLSIVVPNRSSTPLTMNGGWLRPPVTTVINVIFTCAGGWVVNAKIQK